MKKYEETRQLPVALNDHELLEFGQQLARANVAALSAENVRKNTNAQLKADVDAKEAQVERLTSIVASREEVRPVPCIWKMCEPKAGKKSLVRLDTNAVVESRDMVGDDMQPDLEPIVKEVDVAPLALTEKGTASETQETDWQAVREFYADCRSIKKTAERFGLNANTLKARIRREGWAKQ